MTSEDYIDGVHRKKLTINDLTYLYKLYQTKDQLNGVYKQIDLQTGALRNRQRELNSPQAHKSVTGKQIFGYIIGFFILITFLTFVPYLVGLIILGIVVAFVVKRHRNKNIDRDNQRNKQVQEINEQIVELNGAKSDAIHKVSQLPDVSDIEGLLPSDFRNTSGIADLFSAIYQNEADSIKEAIQITREKYHRANMEQMAQQGLDDQRRASQDIIANQKIMNDAQAEQIKQMKEIKSRVSEMEQRDRERYYYR